MYFLKNLEMNCHIVDGMTILKMNTITHVRCIMLTYIPCTFRLLLKESESLKNTEDS